MKTWTLIKETMEKIENNDTQQHFVHCTQWMYVAFLWLSPPFMIINAILYSLNKLSCIDINKSRTLRFN